MAQLPPKIPTVTQNWPSFSHQTMSNYFSTAAATMENHQPCWVDEFLDFTSTRRGAHRRSISDSITFIETTNMPSLVEDQCHDNNSSSCNNNHSSSTALIPANLGFDKLDDDQLMSMFSHDMSLSLPPSSSNPSTPSDQNSKNDEKPSMPADQHRQQQEENTEQKPAAVAKTEPGEVESSCKQESHQPPPPTSSNNGDSINDPKRVKSRILANRQSAQRSRVRKLQYISELERSVTTLQTEVSALSPRVAFLDHQRLILNVDNSALKQRIAALAQDKIFKDAHQEALKKEIERLRQVYHHQNLKKMNSSSHASEQSPNHEAIQCSEN
ncbi:hypothetical protein OIU84_024600 [Salix udensis]|uniref:BZIP domain-containing protein n=1 Tax=Salix udensis TaxID=889485 RepID=A0AAD6PBQ9_9ROSI|nr:hypothetical protein OIU84_024600 [Salix udensis]